MPTIAEFFDKPDIKGKAVAARLQNPRVGSLPDLYYHAVDTLGTIPPSVFLVEGMDAGKIACKGKVLVNYAPVTWINSNSDLERKFATAGTEAYSGTAKPIKVDMGRWNQFSLAKLGPKPKSVAMYGDPVTRASSRARRIYMLGAFCLLKLAGTLKGWQSNGHNIASLLVSNEGEVLSWGVNDGAFRHAEVNTIISYFLRNDRASSLPKKSLLFTTLKPCQMCSTYIKSTWGTGETQIWFGMKDSGASGGTPILGEKAKEFSGENVEFDLWKTDDEELTTGTKPVQVNTPGGKVALTAELNVQEGKRGRASAADWVDSSDEVAKLFKAAQDKFAKKVGKPARDDGPVKEVLDYLAPWLG